MSIDMGNPRILSPFFLLLGQVEHHIVTIEVRVAIDYGPRLLIMDRDDLLNGLQELIQKSLFFLAKSHFRDVDALHRRLFTHVCTITVVGFHNVEQWPVHCDGRHWATVTKACARIPGTRYSVE